MIPFSCISWLVLSLWIGLLAHVAAAEPDQERIGNAIAMVEGRHHGVVRFDPKHPDRPAIAVDLTDTGAGNRALESVRVITTVKTLLMEGTKINDKGVLEHLPAMTYLRTLSLGDDVTDAGLVCLKGLNQLETLYLGPKVTDVGLAQLAHLPKLHVLYISNTQVTNVGLGHLRNITGLKTLLLANTKVSDSGLVHFKGLSDLRTLSLSFTNVSDESIVHLKQLKQLRRLFLIGTRVSDTGVNELRSASPNLSIVR